MLTQYLENMMYKAWEFLRDSDPIFVPALIVVVHFCFSHRKRIKQTVEAVRHSRGSCAQIIDRLNQAIDTLDLANLCAEGRLLDVNELFARGANLASVTEDNLLQLLPSFDQEFSSPIILRRGWRGNLIKVSDYEPIMRALIQIGHIPWSPMLLCRDDFNEALRANKTMMTALKTRADAIKPQIQLLPPPLKTIVMEYEGSELPQATRERVTGARTLSF